jgi:putative oxidoreductase
MDFLAPYRSPLLSIMRIAIAIVFLQHPAAKFLGIPDLGMHGLTPWFWPYGIAGSIETVFGLLLLVGLWSRLAAFILSGEMAFAYFMGHASVSFFPLVNKGEPAVIWCFVFLYLAAAGPGPWSIDAMMGREKATA